MSQPQEQTIQTLIPENIETIEVASISSAAEELEGLTTIEWAILASAIVGVLLVIAIVSRFTPFKNGVADLFTTLAKLARGNK